MKVFIFLSLVAGAFAFLDEDCPSNSHYEECGTACPLTCENYKDPEPCVLMCKAGCHCDEGYVQTKDGKCVDPDNCPSHPDAKCGENKHYNECGTACPLTCDNYKNPPKICNLMCKTGCECDKGYVVNAKGQCVEPKDCSEKEKNCHEEADTGMCRGYFPMFYYDTESKSCKEFIYGGCQGNGNRYATKEECSRRCEDIELAYVTCEQEKEVGPCRGAFPRFFYNKHTEKCEQFIYGGCQGNDNNFSSEEDCEAVCIKHL